MLKNIPKKEQEKYPVHIYIHGGGFVAGNKNCRKAIGYYLAHNSNNIVLNVEYGKSPKFTMIESVQQLKNVLDFIYINGSGHITVRGRLKVEIKK